MLAVQAKLTGLDQALGKLAKVKAAVGKRILARELGKAGRKAAGAMKAAAPVSTDATAPQLIHGLLKLSFAAKVKAYRQSSVVVVVVGPRSNYERAKKTGKRGLSAFGRRVARKAARAGKSARQTPTQYAHLAGPGRKQRFLAAGQQALEGMAGAIAAGIQAGIAEAVR